MYVFLQFIPLKLTESTREYDKLIRLTFIFENNSFSFLKRCRELNISKKQETSIRFGRVKKFKGVPFTCDQYVDIFNGINILFELFWL